MAFAYMFCRNTINKKLSGMISATPQFDRVSVIVKSETSSGLFNSDACADSKQSDPLSAAETAETVSALGFPPFLCLSVLSV